MLAFLKALLFGGNAEIQDGLEYLKETREESLFITLKTIVKQASLGYRERSVDFMTQLCSHTQSTGNNACLLSQERSTATMGNTSQKACGDRGQFSYKIN